MVKLKYKKQGGHIIWQIKKKKANCIKNYQKSVKM